MSTALANVSVLEEGQRTIKGSATLRLTEKERAQIGQHADWSALQNIGICLPQRSSKDSSLIIDNLLKNRTI